MCVCVHVLRFQNSHLDGTVLHSGGVVLDALTRPSLLITDAYNSKVIHPARKDRYAAMFGKVGKSKKNHRNRNKKSNCSPSK